MSLDKAIEHGKERRRPYHGGKAIDKSCRNHGGCDYCLGNRMYQARRMKAKMDDIELEALRFSLNDFEED